MKNLKQDMINVGRAMLTLELQNTHSGNISAREKDDMLITKTGSMKGHLQVTDLVNPGIYQPKSGLFQASSETGTHQKILQYAGSAVHAHSLPATLISYYAKDVEPNDILGKTYLGHIPIIEFEYPIGSKEMEEKIPEILRKHPAMIIKTHGPICRGSTVYESFFLMNVVDYSCNILLNMDKLNIPSDKIPGNGYPKITGYSLPSGIKETRDNELIRQFKLVASDMFTLKLSPIHTGSISVRDGKEMLYSPRASSPEYIDNEIFRLKLGQDFEDFFHILHQAVYRHSHSQAAVFTHSPQALIQGFQALWKREDRIIPVDAEGGYLYPAVPVILPDEDMKKIIKKAERYKMVVIAGIGVLALGYTPTHCIHHNSSLKNICILKTELDILEKTKVLEDPDQFIKKRGKEW